MLSPDTIRRAVEIAGWKIKPTEPSREGFWALELVLTPWRQWSELANLPQGILDALAAQLVRQVDALEQYAVYEYDDCTEIVELIEVAFGDGMAPRPIPAKPNSEATAKGNDRISNTINAIVQFDKDNPGELK